MVVVVPSKKQAFNVEMGFEQGEEIELEDDKYYWLIFPEPTAKKISFDKHSGKDLRNLPKKDLQNPANGSETPLPYFLLITDEEFAYIPALLQMMANKNTSSESPVAAPASNDTIINIKNAAKTAFSIATADFCWMIGALLVGLALTVATGGGVWIAVTAAACAIFLVAGIAWLMSSALALTESEKQAAVALGIKVAFVVAFFGAAMLLATFLAVTPLGWAAMAGITAAAVFVGLYMGCAAADAWLEKNNVYDWGKAFVQNMWNNALKYTVAAATGAFAAFVWTAAFLVVAPSIIGAMATTAVQPVAVYTLAWLTAAFTTFAASFLSFFTSLSILAFKEKNPSKAEQAPAPAAISASTASTASTATLSDKIQFFKAKLVPPPKSGLTLGM